MNISQLGYDIEQETITFNGVSLQCGDMLDVLIPSPANGELIWVPVRLVWEGHIPQRWRLISQDTTIDRILNTCNPVGLFGRIGGE